MVLVFRSVKLKIRLTARKSKGDLRLRPRQNKVWLILSCKTVVVNRVSLQGQRDEHGKK